MPSPPPLEGFDSFPFTADDATRTVSRRGSGPAVVAERLRPA